MPDSHDRDEARAAHGPERTEVPPRSIFCALPDSVGGERRSPPAPNGLPILSTEPLNAAERQAIRAQLRALEVAHTQLEAALEGGRVSHALDAMQWSVTAGQFAERLAVELGRGR